MIQEHLEPPADHWKDHLKPMYMEDAIRYAAENIAIKGSKTCYQEIYDAIYEILEPNVEEEYAEQSRSIQAFG